MYLKSLKEAKRSTSSSAPTTANASTNGPPPIWSAIALQRHYASMLPKGTLPAGPTSTTMRQTRSSSQRADPPAPSANAKKPPRVIAASNSQKQEVPCIAPPITRAGVAISGLAHTSTKELLAAHALGLVELPPPPPTTKEWDSLVGQAAHRGAGSMEHHACPICLERFMTNPSAPLVILNCSHVYHKVCLSQMERFLHKANEKVVCPMCRKGNYYKRPLVEGTTQLREMAATKIQSWVRGRRARRKYLTMRLKANPKFRSDYAYDQLSKISDYYLNSALAREKEVDDMLEALDLQRQKAMADIMTDADWDAIRSKILQRALDPACAGQDEDMAAGVECPICMVAVVDEVSGEVCPTAVMLSCTHAFHGPCLDSFERMGNSKGGTTQCIPRCAVCRKGYTRRPILDAQ